MKKEFPQINQNKSNKFRNPCGVRYLKGLFYEMTLADKSTVLYTLKDQDYQGFPSLYRLYMTMEDWTEYEFAMTFMEGWEHWEMLCKCPWFKPTVTRWRQELELKLKARLLNIIVEDAQDQTSKTSTSSAKYLLQEGWAKDTKSSKGRGRPSKAEIADAAERMASFQDRVNDDFSRLQVLEKKEIN